MCLCEVNCFKLKFLLSCEVDCVLVNHSHTCLASLIKLNTLLYRNWESLNYAAYHSTSTSVICAIYALHGLQYFKIKPQHDFYPFSCSGQILTPEIIL